MIHANWPKPPVVASRANTVLVLYGIGFVIV